MTPQENSFEHVAAEIGALVAEKNRAYGSAFDKCGDFLRLLWPKGIAPEQYTDALAMVRIFDKQMRIATDKHALGESPYRDIAGYAILGVVKDARETARAAMDNAAWTPDKASCRICFNNKCALMGKDGTEACSTFIPPEETARAAFTPVKEKIDISDMPNGSVVYSPSTPVQEEVEGEWVTKSLCKQCNNPDVVCYQGQLKVNGTCKDFRP